MSDTVKETVTEIHPLVEKLRQQAISAFNWTSQDPEGAGNRLIDGYGRELTQDVETIKDNDGDIDRYTKKYVSMLSDWLSAKSRCASSFITGGSGFNVGKANKANDSEHKKQGDFYAWREKALHAITKSENTDIVKGTEGALDKLQAKYDDMVIKNDRLKALNKLLRSKKLTLEEIKQKLKDEYNYSDEKITEIYSYNYGGGCPKYGLYTAKINLLGKEIEGEKMRLARYDEGDKEYTLNGVDVVENLEANRIQLFYDGKPESDTITILKKNGMRWSPKNGCWQRQLTTNAVNAVKYIILKNKE